MSQWNNKRNPCVTHHITSKLTKRIRRKSKEHEWGWYQHGTKSNEGCKITEKSFNKNFKRDCIKVAQRYMWQPEITVSFVNLRKWEIQKQPMLNIT